PVRCRDPSRRARRSGCLAHAIRDHRGPASGLSSEPGERPGPRQSQSPRRDQSRRPGRDHSSDQGPMSQPHLRRALGLWNLIFIGMVIIQPTAPMGIYGVISNTAQGHVGTTVLIAMVAMLFTAISYGRMARVYP